MLSRRTVLTGAAAGVAGATVLGNPSAAVADDATVVEPAATVLPGDARYQEMTVGHNTRWVGTPDAVKVVHNTTQAVAAVQEAVTANKRLAVRGGGHCYADFVFNPAVRTLIDMTQMDEVYYDTYRKAFVVEAGATLLHAYQALYKGWGVALPAGLCYSVGIGGHVAGGGFGLLSRQYGVTVDHLYGVEVVVVDATGRAKSVVATREAADPRRDLWWAHTGGGGGNFGLVTRYFFRSPDATGTAAKDQLMKPPKDVYLSAVSLPWADFDKARFTALVRHYGDWHERNSTMESPSSGLTSLLVMNHRSNGGIGIITQLDAAVPNAQQLIESYLAEITDPTGVDTAPLAKAVGEQGPLPAFFTPRKLPWLTSVRLLGTNNPALTNPTLRSANKSAYHRKGFTVAQAGALYNHLTRTDFSNPVANVMLFGYGSKVNTVPAADTASAQRDSVFKALYATQWSTPADDARNTAWLREVYAEVYSSSGGYPVPNASTDGCYVNYPDVDITDPAQNTSGVPWTTLYYKEHYPRLQQVKKAYDPKNVFRHAQSIALP
ncbi:FAD-binding oxidoreductase [Streptomyces sp. NPDC088745]|uniref:FAD-binding oxidoreductase n=1 Tax=Streptomyces sp. NPDC088745 TaxID=3365884 RepID=UPI003813C7D7